MASLRLIGAIFAACLGMFILGLSIGWGSPSVPLLQQENSSYNMTSSDCTWAVSILKIGALIGAVTTIFLVDVVGRKPMLLFSTIPTSVGWVVIGLANGPAWILVGRLCTGFSTGLIYCVTPTYLSEVAPAENRGSVGISCTLAMYCAVVFAFAAGPFLAIDQYAFISAALSLLHGVLLWSLLPETPYFLMSRKQHEAARGSLQRLRTEMDIMSELNSIERISEERASLSWRQKWGSVLQKDNLKTLMLGMTLVLMNALSGEIIVLNNAESLFGKIENNFLAANYLSVILALAQIVVYPICMHLVDRRGRKPLLLTSAIGIIMCSVTIGAYFFAKEHGYQVDHVSWIPSVAFIAIIISASLGLVPITVLMVSEIFPMHIKFICVGLCTTVFYVFSFAELQLFMVIMDATNAYTTFWILAVLNVLNMIIVFVLIPETKGQSLEEIQIKMNTVDKR